MFLKLLRSVELLTDDFEMNITSLSLSLSLCDGKLLSEAFSFIVLFEEMLLLCDSYCIFVSFVNVGLFCSITFKRMLIRNQESRFVFLEF